MKELLLIRHGETDHNRELRITGFSDIPLNSAGISQAQKLKEKFMSEGITAIYSSDLQRCVETSEIISGGIKPVTTPKLREMNFGIFETLTGDEAKASYPDEYNFWMNDILNYRIPAGESNSDMIERVLSFFSELLSGSAERAAVISHSGCIRTVLSFYLMGSVEDTWRFFIDNCTITRLCFSGDYAYLKSLNEK